MDVRVVILPGLGLRCYEMLVDVIAQRLAHERVLFHRGQRLAQVAGQFVDPQPALFPMRHGEYVFVHGRAGIELCSL